MGKKKSVVLLTLITIVIVVLCAVAVFPSFHLSVFKKDSVKTWNPVVTLYDTDEELNGGYVARYYPAGVISATEYDSNCRSISEQESAEKLQEYKDSYVKHGGVYLSTAREGISTYPTSVKSLALEDALDALGVTRYYGSAVTAVYTRDGRLCGAELFGERFVRIRASVVIDGADGAVCRLLGLPTLPGRKCDNRTARFARTVAMRDGEGRLCGAWHQGDALPQNAGTEEISARFLRWSAKPPCYAERFDRGNRLL